MQHIRRCNKVRRGRPSGISVGSFGKTTYEQVKAAEWMERLLASDFTVINDEFYEFFQCLSWCIGDLRLLLYKMIEWIEEEPDTHQKAEALEALHSAEDWSANSLSRNFDDIVSEHPYVVEAIRQCALDICSETGKSKCASDMDIYVQAKKKINKIFSLSPLALKLLELFYMLQDNRTLDSYFNDTLGIWKASRRNALSRIMDTTSSTLKKAIMELIACGILDFDSGTGYRVSHEIISIWESPDTYDVNQLFCTSLKGDILPLDRFRIPKEDVQYMRDLLSSNMDKPVHIMLYGAPGTGKTTFARSLAHDMKFKTWSVNSRDDDNDNDRRASLSACLNLSSKHKNSFVLVDEAERLLDTSGFGGSKTKDKAWLNSLLEKHGNRVIWITNHVNHIDLAVRRRFSFSIYFEELGQEERQVLWKEIIVQHKTENYVTEEQIHLLARNYSVPAAAIETAVEQAKTLGYDNTRFFPAVKCSLNAYSSFMKNGVCKSDKKRQDIKPPKGFTLDGTTLEGSLSDLMERCRRADEAIKGFQENNDELESGCATILFYGPPGTGKTALARHIAYELNRKCIVKRASDLLNCYVGNTEKLIASAFYQAEKDGAVLVIDEADSFLYSRDKIQHSWEAGFINEFLTQLEECRCFCICTTNRLDDLDEATLRRFSYKVPFTWAKPQQIMALYNTLLAPLCKSPLTPELERELTSFTRLTPGDFHAVCSQYNPFFSKNSVSTHEDMIAALKREETMKARYAKRNAGF